MQHSKRTRIEAYPCRVCLQNCTTSQASICCDGCQSWLHTTCVTMSDEQLESFSSPDVMFLCRSCACDRLTGRWALLIRTLLPYAVRKIVSLAVCFLLIKHTTYAIPCFVHQAANERFSRSYFHFHYKLTIRLPITVHIKSITRTYPSAFSLFSKIVVSLVDSSFTHTCPSCCPLPDAVQEATKLCISFVRVCVDFVLYAFFAFRMYACFCRIWCSYVLRSVVMSQRCRR